MNKTFIKILTVIILITFFIPISNVFAAVYSKPEFRGRVIDADTKQPIEGAVVVVKYYKMHLLGAPGGPSVSIMAAKETLTDKNGEFFLPSYSTLMLISKEIPIRFIFYKPGYMYAEGASLKNAGISDIGISFEKYFSSGEIGKEAEIEEGSFEDSSYVKWKGPVGIIELKKVQANKAMSPGSISDDYGPNQLPLYYKAIEEDLVNRGIIQGGKKK